MSPLTVGANAVLNPRNAMKISPLAVISNDFRRLWEYLSPSSPISRSPTETVIVNMRRPQIRTQRLLTMFASVTENSSHLGAEPRSTPAGYGHQSNRVPLPAQVGAGHLLSSNRTSVQYRGLPSPMPLPLIGRPSSSGYVSVAPNSRPIFACQHSTGPGVTLGEEVGHGVQQLDGHPVTALHGTVGYAQAGVARLGLQALDSVVALRSRQVEVQS